MFCLPKVKGDKSGYCRKLLPCYGPPQLLKQTVASYGILQIVFTPKECGILYTHYTYLSPSWGSIVYLIRASQLAYIPFWINLPEKLCLIFIPLGSINESSTILKNEHYYTFLDVCNLLSISYNWNIHNNVHEKEMNSF